MKTRRISLRYLELLKKDPNFDLEEFKKIGWSSQKQFG
jgi:hypothetical protein